MNNAPGVVVGAPRWWLGAEAVILLAGSLIAYGVIGQHWWYVAIGILIPDFAMGGYLAGNRIGAHVYNAAHATPLPALLLGLGYGRDSDLTVALALIWLAHIGMDRALGMGLKYGDRFPHTHLGDASAERG